MCGRHPKNYYDYNICILNSHSHDKTYCMIIPIYLFCNYDEETEKKQMLRNYQTVMFAVAAAAV